MLPGLNCAELPRHRHLVLLIILRVFHVVKCSVERQPGAHPDHHVCAQPVARRPEVVFVVPCETRNREHLGSLEFDDRPQLIQNSK